MDNWLRSGSLRCVGKAVVQPHYHNFGPQVLSLRVHSWIIFGFGFGFILIFPFEVLYWPGIAFVRRSLTGPLWHRRDDLLDNISRWPRAKRYHLELSFGHRPTLLGLCFSDFLSRLDGRFARFCDLLDLHASGSER
jgi:hypothetical protein